MSKKKKYNLKEGEDILCIYVA